MNPASRTTGDGPPGAQALMGSEGRHLPLWGLTIGALTVATSLALLLVVALRVLRYPGGAAPDFRIFLAAGHAIIDGANPYRPTTLGRLVNPHPMGGGPPPGLRFPYMPWVAYSFSAIARLPTGWAVALWELGSVVVVAATGWLLARELAVPHPAWAAAAVATSGIATADYALGETDAIMLALISFTLVAVMRGRVKSAAAAATAAALLKPQLAILLPVCVVLAFASGGPQQRRAGTGALATLVVLAGLPALARPGMTASWVRLLISFSASVSRSQVGLGGFDGLARLLPAGAARLAGTSLLVGLVVAAAGILLCGATISWVRHSPWFMGDNQRLAQAWILALPLAIWLLATPYSHPNDLLLAYPLSLLVLGPAPAEWRRPAVWAAFLIILLGPTLFALITGSLFHFTSLAGLWLLPLVVVAVVQLHHKVGQAPTISGPELGLEHP